MGSLLSLFHTYGFTALLVFAILLLSVWSLWLYLDHARDRSLLDALSANRTALQNEYQQLSEADRILRSSHADLETAYVQLNRSYDNITADYTQLSESYRQLQSTHEDLETSYDNLETRYQNLSSFRLPKDIQTSSLSGIDFLRTGDALVIGYPELALVSGANTTSMQPTISIGHLAIVTRHFDPFAFHIGDIVAYNSSRYPVPIAHRIVGIGETNDGANAPGTLCYTTQGDSNQVPDPECVRPSQIVYQVIGVIFGANSEGFQTCPANYAALAIDGRLDCVPDQITAGVYTADQPLDRGSRYPLCADSQPAKPYTVVSPNGSVYCSSSPIIPG